MGGILQRVINNPDKFSTQQLIQGMRDNIIPSYIAIPIVAQRNQQAQMQQAMQQEPPQPPLAQQVLQQNAQNEQPMPQGPQQAPSPGLDQLASNLPANYKAGGIVGYEDGGQVDEDIDLQPSMDEGEDDDYDSGRQQAMAVRDQLMQSLAGSPDISSVAGLYSPQKHDLGALNRGQLTNAVPEVAQLQQEISKGMAPKYMAEGIAGLGDTRGAKHKYAEQIIKEALAQGVDPKLALGIAQNETGGLKNPESAKSSAGALGVMQLMPGTAKDLGVANALDPMQNIRGGVKYLSDLSKRFKDPKLVAAAYNAGPGNVNKYGGVPPFKETQAYVNKLAGFAEGGIVQNFAEGGDVASESATPFGRWWDVFSDKVASILPPPNTQYQANEAARNALIRQYGPSSGLAGLFMKQSDAERQKAQDVMRQVSQASLSSPAPGSAGMQQLAGQYLTPPTVTPANVPALAINQDPYANETARLGNYAAPEGSPSPEVAAPTASPTQDYPGSDIIESMGSALSQDSGADAPPDSYNLLKNYITDRESELTKDKNDAINYALISAGLGMLGGSSPFGSVNIGKGGQEGLNYLMNARKLQTANQNAIMSGLGGLNRAQTQYMWHQMAAKDKADLVRDNKDWRYQQLAINKQLADEKLAQNQRQFDLSSQKIDQSTKAQMAKNKQTASSNFLKASQQYDSSVLDEQFRNKYGKNYMKNPVQAAQFNAAKNAEIRKLANAGIMDDEDAQSNSGVPTFESMMGGPE